ncbi:hypothetical protein SAMN05446935_7643 [Burkholderia sp. YR290]|nr:hypothetical protein SAMN05446935_7643 [Burkholderia sp. YR290]
MSFDTQRLYELLPAIYRIRDAKQGEQLKALLGIVADQIGILEDDLAQLYDDQFIETCAQWVVPYIGDLIGYRSLHTSVPHAGIRRAEVAHTIAFRRRKGTAAMLEQLARDVTGWNARAVEFFQILAWTQYMNHLRPQNVYAPNLRQQEALERLNGAFDTISHTVDVRHMEQGARYNIRNIGIFFWRFDAYSLTRSPAVPVAPGDTQRFVFSSLGLSEPLFTRPEPETRIDHLADPVNVPDPISRRVLDAHLSAYYGADKSIYVEGFEIGSVDACNLSDAGVGAWAHSPAPGRIAIDPVLGRVAFGTPQTSPPMVTFHYGFSAPIGGGEYDRSETIDPELPLVTTIPAPNPTIQGALNLLTGGGAAEISDNGRYSEALAISVAADKQLELRAADKHRPTIVLAAPLEISGGARATVTLSGLMITGGPIRISAGGGNQLQRLRILHCTLVPATQPCLVVDLPDVEIQIERSIVGGLRVVDGARITITDSIVDATTQTEVALSAPDALGAGGVLTIIDSTVIGKVHTEEMKLATNSIFLADLAANDPWLGAGKPGTAVRSERKQAGCVRFSYVPWSAIVPRRYRCVPASAEDTVRIRPQFTSMRYGDPGYGQLALATPTQIRNGADDEGEIGAFHLLYQPQREANMRVRLKEYLRFSLEAGFYYVT